MNTTTAPRTARKPATLTTWAGWLMLAMALVHSTVGIGMFADQWPNILGGALQWDMQVTKNFETHLAFWFVAGSFALPQFIIGLLTIGRAREGRSMPAYVAWILLADAIIGGWLIFPSGHVWGLIPITLLLIDRYGKRIPVSS